MTYTNCGCAHCRKDSPGVPIGRGCCNDNIRVAPAASRKIRIDIATLVWLIFLCMDAHATALASLLPADTYYQTVFTLNSLLPPPANDTPEDTARRDRAAMAHVASLRPADPEEANLAAQYVRGKRPGARQSCAWPACTRMIPRTS